VRADGMGFRASMAVEMSGCPDLVGLVLNMIQAL
jgi:hypothetical protein